MWIDPRPVLDDIGKLYRHYYTHNASKHGLQKASLSRVIQNAVLASRFGYNHLAELPIQRRLGAVLSWIGPIREMAWMSVMTLEGPPNGRVLDVGCGSGDFLAEMRALGWDVVGVEPDRRAANVAREQFGLTVYEGVLEDVRLPPDSFDSIIMKDVIEHVWNPLDTLRECGRLLKPGGKLIVATPNIESLGYRLFRESWRGLEIPRHFFLFSLRALRTCAEQVGLRVVKLWTVAHSARQMLVRSYLIRRDGSIPGGHPAKKGFWLRLGGLAFQTMEYGLCHVADVGEVLMLIAAKSQESRQTPSA